MKESPSVYLSYSYSDKEIAQELSYELERFGINVIFGKEYEFASHEKLFRTIRRKLDFCDYLILLISKDTVSQNLLKSKWIKEESRRFLDFEFSARDVSIIPVLLPGGRIPDYLSHLSYIDLRRNFEKGLKRLISQIEFIKYIDLDNIDPYTFQNLIFDLLRSLKFSKIEKTQRQDSAIDIIAEYNRKDPFGASIIERWAIEVKFYKISRADITTLSNIVEFLKMERFDKAALITNSYLTSTSKEYFKNLIDSENVYIKIIERSELKKLIIKNKKIAKKYFPVTDRYV